MRLKKVRGRARQCLYRLSHHTLCYWMQISYASCVLLVVSLLLSYPAFSFSSRHLFSLGVGKLNIESVRRGYVLPEKIKFVPLYVQYGSEKIGMRKNYKYLDVD